MDSLEDLTKSTNGKPGFFKHVFNFDEDSKSEMTNIVQYAGLAIIPIVIMNKLMQNYIVQIKSFEAISALAKVFS